MTLAEFGNIFGILALQLRCTDADEATIRAYYAALKDLTLELVQMAAERLAREPGPNAAWFPKTAEWRDLVFTIARERRIDQQNRLTHLHRRGSFLCTVCEDTGMAPRANGRFGRCDCQDLRALEIIGRRPLPQLPEGDAA